MSKKLTEKWLDGNLSDDGLYYWRISDGQELIKSKLEMVAYRLCSDAEKIKCLAPVPSYSEYQALKDNCELTHTRLKGTHQKIAQLKKKIGIATKALEELETKSDKFDNSWSIQEQLDFIKAKCQETLYQIKEMEGVK